jgi:PAS domain S-box-containing protein
LTDLRFLRNLRWQLALGAAALTAIASGTVWRAVSLRAALFERVESRLTANAAVTQAAVERWIEERRYDAATAMREVGPSATVAENASSAPEQRVRAGRMLDQRLGALQRGHGYMAVWVVDSAGRVVGGAGADSPAAAELAAVRAAVETGHPQICEPFTTVGGTLAVCYATLVTPADRAGGTGVESDSTLVVLLRSNPAGSLFTLVESLSAGTGQERSHLVARVADDAVVLSPSGTPPVPLRGRWTGAHVPDVIRRALGGTVASGVWTDASGVVVLGGARPVAGTPWAIVRQVDRESILAVYYDGLRTEGLLVVLGVVLLAIAAFTASRTARSRHAREVAASEQRLAATLLASFDAVIVVDEQARIVVFNAAAERMFGCSSAQVVGTPLMAMSPPDVREEHVRTFRAFVESEATAFTIPASGATRARRFDGQEFRFEAAASKGEADGRVIYTLVLRDVTERTRAERERVRSLSLLLATLESTADGILVVDIGGNVVAHNRAFFDVCQIPEESASRDDEILLGLAASRLRDPSTFRSRVQQLYDDPEAQSFETLDFLDGRVVERVSKPQRLGDRVVGRVWSFRDVTDRERAAVALRQSEASARSFVEHSPHGICRTTPEGRVLSVNPALVRMLGYDSAEEIMRVPVAELYADPEARTELLARAHEQLASGSHELLLRRRDRSVIVVRLYSRIELADDGTVGYYESSIEDLTALRAAERALQQSEKLAAVGQFVSGVAHELNNPLSAVLLFAEELMEDEGSGADRETLTQVRDQALRARSIVRDLLSFVRGRAADAVKVDARDALDRIARALGPQVAAGGSRLETQFTDDLGWVEVDRAGLEQVVTNLVINAVHAAPGGRVRIVARRAAGRCHIAVEDEGPGIPADVLPRMFEPFFTTKAVGVGTGLGLSVSLGIAEQHGGTLRAENRSDGEGRGARLVLTLPLTEAPPVARPAVLTAVPLARASALLPRVLLIDDERPIRKALSRYFTRRDWHVDEAEDGAEALEMLLGTSAGDTPYELVISDLRMPGVSGVMLHDRVAAARPALLERLVFSTGDVVSPEAAAFVARTRCAVLEKPFELSDLDALIRRAAVRT